MQPQEAFDAIKQAISSDPSKRVVHARYWPDVFGNFIVAYELGGQPSSIVLDRFELVVCDDLAGDSGCKTVMQSIREANVDDVLRALAL